MCGGVGELSYLTAASKRWGKNSRASVASYPALTFFRTKVWCVIFYLHWWLKFCALRRISNQVSLHVISWRKCVSQKRFCKHCKVPITGRSHKLFCRGNCRKRASEKTQNSFASREKYNCNMRLFDSASRLARIYFQLAPFERLGLMREFIIIARDGDGKMRNILSNAYLTDDENDYGNPFRGKHGKSYRGFCISEYFQLATI